MSLTRIERMVEAIDLCADPDAAADTRLRALAAELLGPDAAARMTRVNGYRSPMSWNHHLRAAIEASDAPAEAVFGVVTRMRNEIMRMHALLALIAKTARREGPDVASGFVEALAPIASGRMQDTRALGVRELLAVHAERGDAADFLALLPRAEARRERSRLDALKATLVSEVCRRDGIDAALTLLEHARFGSRFLGLVPGALTETASYEEMRTLLQRPELAALEEPQVIQLLAETYANAMGRGGPSDGFDAVFERVMQVEPNRTAGDVKLRDWLLMRIAMHQDDLARVQRCRRAIRRRRLKQELQALEARLA